jgi:hypothetical protein
MGHSSSSAAAGGLSSARFCASSRSRCENCVRIDKGTDGGTASRSAKQKKKKIQQRADERQRERESLTFDLEEGVDEFDLERGAVYNRLCYTALEPAEKAQQFVERRLEEKKPQKGNRQEEGRRALGGCGGLDEVHEKAQSRRKQTLRCHLLQTCVPRQHACSVAKWLSCSQMQEIGLKKKILTAYRKCAGP